MNIRNLPDNSRYAVTVPLWLLVAQNFGGGLGMYAALVSALTCSLADAVPVIADAIAARRDRNK